MVYSVHAANQGLSEDHKLELNSNSGVPRCQVAISHSILDSECTYLFVNVAQCVLPLCSPPPSCLASTLQAVEHSSMQSWSLLDAYQLGLREGGGGSDWEI